MPSEREREDPFANLILEFRDANGRRWMAAAFLGMLRSMDPASGDVSVYCSPEAMESQLPDLRVTSFKVVRYGGR